MNDDTTKVIEKRIRLSPEQARRAARLALERKLTDEEMIERLLHSLLAQQDESERVSQQDHWSHLSEDALHRVWDNEEDSVYDNWQEIYGAPAG